jgi:hypothetical protein
MRMLNGRSNGDTVMTWIHMGTNVKGFNVQRAPDPAFMTGVTTYALGQGFAFSCGRQARRVTYNYRIRAVKVPVIFTWMNAATFPIVTP